MTQRKSTIEKDFFAKGPQALNIKQLLLIPPEYRTYQHCKIIINHVKDVKFLERYMDSDQIYELAKEFQIKSYDANSVVFKQGEPADAFYIILSGSVKVFITIPSDIKHFSNMKEVMKLERGDAFGELALLYDSVRSATIVTDESTELIVLDKESFRKHIRTISTTHLSQIMEFFKDFPAFQSLQINEIARYASKSLIYRFPTNTVIAREHDSPTEIYFIKSGRVKVIRRLNFKIHPYSRTLLLEDPSEPTEEEVEKGLFKSMLIEIDELSNGDSFCDYSILHKQPMHHSIVSSIPCELIALPVYDITDMDERTISEYKNVCKPYPDDTELRKMYLDLYRWNVWKKNLYKNIQIEKSNKKRGFSQQLREPFEKMIYMEKLAIPLDGNIDIEALKVFSKTSKGIKTTPAKSKAGINFSSIQQNTTTNNDVSKRSVVLPRIGKNSKIQNTDTSMGLKGKDTSSYLNRKFDFVVPQHKLNRPEDIYKKTMNGDILNLNDTMETAQNDGQVRPNELRAPFPFSLDDTAMDNDKSPHKSDDGSPLIAQKSDEVAQTLDKVFTSIQLDGFKLPSLKK